MPTMKIIDTTDGRFLGKEWSGSFPVVLDDDFTFIPDHPCVEVSPGVHRFATSNYIIDVKEQ